MESTLSSLGINIAAVIWHVVNFVILLLILQRFLYKPVLKMLDDRAARIKESLAQAEAARAETARLEHESRGILDEARRGGQEILANANRNAERINAEARQQAQAETERLIEQARAEIERERNQAFVELRQQIADLAVSAAGRVINRSLDDPTHRELVREFLAEDVAGRQS
ncbi:MAG: F-type H+-transporting ATPase subunit b [Chloroflexota bacterium]|jgi:F-type H+-transporting ATPase subunit b|nr:F-type H+-transporting ATPase subunit b [Chloroflexota bacterium]